VIAQGNGEESITRLNMAEVAVVLTLCGESRVPSFHTDYECAPQVLMCAVDCKVLFCCAVSDDDIEHQLIAFRSGWDVVCCDISGAEAEGCTLPVSAVLSPPGHLNAAASAQCVIAVHNDRAAQLKGTTVNAVVVGANGESSLSAVGAVNVPIIINVRAAGLTRDMRCATPGRTQADQFRREH
jgi:hypothetical protein